MRHNQKGNYLLGAAANSEPLFQLEQSLTPVRRRSSIYFRTRRYNPLFGEPSRELSCNFSAVGTVEEHPHGEVGREVFEAMVLAGGDEDKRAWRDVVTTLTVEKETFALGDQIDFVARMGFLRVVFVWG